MQTAIAYPIIKEAKEGHVMKLTRSQTVLAFITTLYGAYLALYMISNFFGVYAPAANVDLPIDDQRYWWQFFYFFTQQNNMLLIAWCLAFGLSSFFGWKRVYHFVNQRIVLVSLTVYLSIVFIIVALVQNPIFTGAWLPFKSSSEFIYHNFSSIFMWLMFFFIPGEGKVKPVSAWWILIYPFVYFIAHTFIGLFVTFPNGDMAFNYQFINPLNYAGSNYVVWVVLIVALVGIFGVFGLGLIAFKNYLDRNFYTSAPLVTAKSKKNR